MLCLRLTRSLRGLCHFGHQFEEDFGFSWAKRLEHGSSHGELALEKRVIEPLAFFAERYLDDPAIGIYASPLHQFLAHQLVQDVGSGAESEVEYSRQVAHDDSAFSAYALK